MDPHKSYECSEIKRFAPFVAAVATATAIVPTSPCSPIIFLFKNICPVLNWIKKINKTKENKYKILKKYNTILERFH